MNATVDRRGDCCASGKVDACGVCDGQGQMRSRRGKCCTGEPGSVLLDSAGRCCTNERLDACGVCDGTGSSCRLVLGLVMPVPANVTADDLAVEGSYARYVYCTITNAVFHCTWLFADTHI